MRHFVVRFTLAALAACLIAGSGFAQRTETRPVEGIIFDLDHPNKERRKEAALLCGQHRLRQCVPKLIEVTEDPEDDVRLEAVRALVRINDTRALQAYIRLLQDSRKPVQEKAIEGIINIYVVEEGGFVRGLKKVVDFVNPFSDDYNPLVVEPYVPVSREATTALADLLFADDRDLRREAATALGILRSRESLSAIQEALSRETSNGVKVELIRAIYKIGDADAGAAIVPFIRDSDKKVHDEAIFAVGRLQVREAVPQLNEMYQAGLEERRRILGIVPVSGTDDLQRKVLEALAHLGDPRSQEIFLDALTDSRDFYRRYGAEGLGRSGANEHIGLVATKYLRESSSSVKLAMGFALFRLGREEHLVEMIDAVAGSEQALFYLLELEPEKVRQLYPHLHTERDATKVQLLEVIGMRGDSEAIAVVQELTGARNADVASAANLALRRLHARHP